MIDAHTHLGTALRQLRRRPGQAALIVGVLGLGIGLVAAVWGIAWGTLWRGLPYPEADRLYAVFVPDSTSSQGRDTVSANEFLHLATPSTGAAEANADAASAIEQVEGWLPLAFVITGLDRHAVQTNGTYITPHLLDTVPVTPLLGRKVLDEGTGAEAVIGERLWREHLGGDASAIGRILTINERPTRVVGVMPETFRFPYDQELWVSFDTQIRDRFGWVQTLVRLRDGAEPQRAATELSTRLPVDPVSAEKGAASSSAPPLVLEPHGYAYHDPQTEKALHLALVAVLALLLVAAANSTNLMLVRGLDRGRELAIRSALGAPRRSLVKLLTTEALVLAMAGVVVGLLVAAAGLKWHGQIAPDSGPSWIDVRFGLPVVLAAVIAGGLCCLVAGVFPAWRTIRAATEQQQLREAGRGLAGLGSGRLRRSLVIAQVALSTGLLLGMGNLDRALERLDRELAPLDRGDVVVMRLSVYGTRHGKDAEKLPTLWDHLRDHLEHRPEIRSAAWADDPTRAERSLSFELEKGAGAGEASLAAVSPGFFGLLDQAPIAGRDFYPTEGRRGTEGQEGGEPVALVSRSFAERHFDDPNTVLGTRLRYDPERNPQAPWRTIVGVVPDLALGGLGAADRAGIYVPRAEWARTTSQHLVIRLEPGLSLSQAPPERLAEAAVHAFDSEIAIYWTHTLDRQLREGLADRTRTRSLLSIFGTTALLLAASGLFGILALTVTHRRHELAIRSALGARPSALARLVVKSGLYQTSIGLVLGLVFAAFMAKALENLYGIDPWQPKVILVLLATLATVAGLAAGWPGSRAAKTDPAEVLRDA